jgi:predicted nucleic acid-binding protein
LPARLLVDTDVLVDYLRGQQEAAEWLEGQAADLFVSAITVAELFAGAMGERENEVLDRFLIALEVLPATDDIGRLAGRYRRQFGPSHGTGLAGALIAATATVHRASLVTFNRRRFPMLDAVVVPHYRS